jgi:hypothetical protein
LFYLAIIVSIREIRRVQIYLAGKIEVKIAASKGIGWPSDRYKGAAAMGMP